MAPHLLQWPRALGLACVVRLRAAAPAPTPHSPDAAAGQQDGGAAEEGVLDQAVGVASGVKGAVLDALDAAACAFGSNLFDRGTCSTGSNMVADNATLCEDQQTEGDVEMFCGQSFQDKVLYCPCCADHLLGDLPLRASLLVPGSPEEVAAWVRDAEGGSCRRGWLRTWSLGGGRLPTAVCDRGLLKCRCEDGFWREEEPSCRFGKACAAPTPPGEGHAVSHGLEVGDRVRAAMDLEYQWLPSDGGKLRCPQVRGPGSLKVPAGARGVVMARAPSIGVRWEDFAQLSNAMAFRDQIVKVVEEAPGPNASERLPSCAAPSGEERFSIGGSLCEDMSLEQCPAHYARSATTGRWHTCDVDEHAVRFCGATVVTEEAARASSERWLAWAAELAFLPELGWPVHYLENGVLRANATTQLLPGDLQTLLRRSLFEEEEEEVVVEPVPSS